MSTATSTSGPAPSRTAANCSANWSTRDVAASPSPGSKCTFRQRKPHSRTKMRAAACLGAGATQTFLYVTLPATLPFILTGMRLAMGNSFATVVSAEMLAANNGLGYLIFSSRLWMATDQIFIGIVSLGVLGILADWIFRQLIVRYASHYGPVE